MAKRLTRPKANVTHNRQQSVNVTKKSPYDYQWRLYSQSRLLEFPICAIDGCNRLADCTDHIIPIEDGGSMWAPKNHQSLCNHHHSQKTKRENVWRGIGAKKLDFG